MPTLDQHMNPIPWRLRAAISDRFPLLYHYAANLLRPRREERYWDDRLAETWHRRTWPTKNALIAGRVQRDDAILDIACGNGSILRDLKSRGFTNLSGLELSRYAVDRLRAEGFTMFHGALPRLPVPDASFDVVIASQILEHVIRRNLFCSEITRVLRPAGQAFFFVPNDCLGPIDEPEHVIKYRRPTFEAFMRKHFEVLAIEVIKDANYSMSILLGQVRRKGAAAPPG
jgi:SAM-dependent methyltransferase